VSTTSPTVSVPAVIVIKPPSYCSLFSVAFALSVTLLFMRKATPRALAAAIESSKVAWSDVLIISRAFVTIVRAIPFGVCVNVV